MMVGPHARPRTVHAEALRAVGATREPAAGVCELIFNKRAACAGSKLLVGQGQASHGARQASEVANVFDFCQRIVVQLELGQ